MIKKDATHLKENPSQRVDGCLRKEFTKDHRDEFNELTITGSLKDK